jgi:hypothetical protein
MIYHDSEASWPNGASESRLIRVSVAGRRPAVRPPNVRPRSNRPQGGQMIEIIPQVVDAAFLYFHTRCSTGDEMAPFVDEMRKGLPNTYIWAGDGCIEGRSDDPIMGNALSTA